MKKIAYFVFLLGALTILFPACYYDNVTDLYPFTPCNLSNVTYSGSISKIMTANCNSCHTASNPSGNVITDTYSGLYKAAITDSLLMKAVKHDLSLYPMPVGGSKLSDCDISKLQLWVDAGAPNN